MSVPVGESPPQDFDAARFRQVLGHYPTGVTVVTAAGVDGTPVGMAVGSFTSVSLDPPLVAFFPEKTSSTFPKIRASGSFCVNVLSAHQEGACRAFAMRGHERFKDVRWRAAASGSPILEGVVAWIDCDIETIEDLGDHHLVVGRVRALHIENPALPLMFFRGGYGEFSSHSLVVADEPDLVRLIRFSSIARPELEALAADVETECTISAAVDSNLVVIASAGSSDSESGPPMVGRRIPMLPPLGGQFMAWEPPEIVDEWLSRSPIPISDEARAVYHAALALVRERRWLVYRSDTGFAQVDRFARRIFREGAGGGVSEEFQDIVAGLAPGFDVVDLDGPEDLAVSRVIAPILGPDGRACLAFNVHFTCGPSAAERLVSVRDRAVAAAARVTAALAGDRDASALAVAEVAER
jgi:flavin reductase (DIM6/NTAB) family NADH-FMN oxidoreductase RutF/DNA-binding IclR family transcriptional regulator